MEGSDFFGAEMDSSRSVELTRLLKAWSDGDVQAFEELVPLVYDELRRLARRYMVRERGTQTLQTTALANEAYLRLVDAASVRWQDRVHFFAVCAQIMRRILIDAARARASKKRGGRVQHLNLDDDLAITPQRSDELVALDDALTALAEFDARKARVVELRFFGGLSVKETAAVVKVSPQSVLRDWKLAKAWLMRELRREATGPCKALDTP
jgi:RNA polymerase sigma factor (TIGR02999 family)